MFYHKDAVIRRGFFFYKLLLIISMTGATVALALVVVSHSTAHPVVNDDPSTFNSKLSWEVDEFSPKLLNQTGTFNWSLRPFSQLSPPLSPDLHEIKSCLSPDLQVHEQATCRFHAVMMDAGSTGTRVHIFEFSHDIKDKNAPFKLERETFTRVSPGLSFYLNNVRRAADSIAPLLNKAKNTILKSQWKHTPIALKATAGLRLLDEIRAESIIREVDRLFDNSGFLMNEGSVSIMTGIDEGIFGWFTLNFLLDRLNFLKQEPMNRQYLQSPHLGPSKSTTAAALDLGGGSTQVTFKPEWNQTFAESRPGFIRPLRLFAKSYDLYTHSYLGNGLMASRLESLKLANHSQNAGFSVYFTTTCLPQFYSLLWSYNDVIYNVSGRLEYGFENCMEEQRAFLQQSLIHQPTELKSREIYIFGYFFDRAKQAGLTGSNGALVSVADFLRVTRKACTRSKLASKDEDQWKCRDLAYITALLQSYGLPDDKKFHLIKKLRNMEVSWALGASYHLLNTYQESQSSRAEFVSQRSPPTVNGTWTPCPCDDVAALPPVTNVWPTGAFLNFTAAFLCTRVYYGLIGLLAATAHLA